MVYVDPHKWSPVSYRSSAGQRKHAGQRPTFYRWTTLSERDRATPLCECGHGVITDVQCQWSADVNARNGDGLTALLLVSRDVDLFERLIDQLSHVYSPATVARHLLAQHACVYIGTTLV